MKKVSNDLKIDFERFCPVDKKENKHIIGLFENDGTYKQFITQGAKKYAYIDKNDKIGITVSGVPKSGSKCLKTLDDFNDGLIFDSEITNKKTLIYCDEMTEITLTDYQGNTETLNNKYGCCLIPATYTLGKSVEYAELLNTSSDRAFFEE